MITKKEMEEDIKSFVNNFGRDISKNKKEFDKKFGDLKRPKNRDRFY